MKRALVLSLVGAVAMLATTAADARPTYVGLGGPLVEATSSNSLAGQGVFTSTIVVTDTGNIVSFDLASLIGATHTWVGDLQVSITSPTGTVVNLFSRVGVTTATGSGNSANLAGNYDFTDGQGHPTFPPAAVLGNLPPGTYQRVTNTNGAVVQQGGVNTNTYAAFTGESITGTWTLHIRDFFPGDTGALGGWSFTATIPGPGAFALLGLAGLVGTRRRRA